MIENISRELDKEIFYNQPEKIIKILFLLKI